MSDLSILETVVHIEEFVPAKEVPNELLAYLEGMVMELESKGHKPAQWCWRIMAYPPDHPLSIEAKKAGGNPLKYDERPGP